MNLLYKYRHKVRLYAILSMTFCSFLILVCVPAIDRLVNPGNNYYTVYVDGEKAGSIADSGAVYDMIMNARKKLASETDDLLLLKMDYNVKAQSMWFGSTDTVKSVENNIYSILKDNVSSEKQKAYTLKINQYMVNLSSMDDITKVLTAVKDKYDTNQQFSVELVSDENRELNVTTSDITRLDKVSNNVVNVSSAVNSGIETPLSLAGTGEKMQFEQGIVSLDFAEQVEIVESYVSPESITPVEQAIDDVTKDKEKSKIYEVVEGDCLSLIAEKNNTTVDKIIEMNENLQDENSLIQIGDELTVTIPEPELSVIRQEEVSYDEDYNADTVYIDNASWYTTEQVVKQESSPGHRSVVALVTYRNNTETGRNIIYEDDTTQAVPRIVERGTITPPTYIKPLSGGRFSSGFAKRWGRMHKGVDWSCPVGTAIKASCSGTVARAGWATGYGNVVYIDHPDGRQTRYGHLSKILVKVGQTVNQGDKIALSGNTGRSTGPHVHFEILINGSQVNPLNYLN